MMSTQPARGMRDFLPEDVRRRDYVVGVIRDVYDRYGFEPLETPAAENIETLLGKYGEEGNKLVFKILKRGEHEASGQADLALRYDLTVPFARVMAEYQAKLPKIFKRYQIQPVWRADRPARGRFREFYQCDIDSVGSTSPVVEAEQMVSGVARCLATLGFDDFVIRRQSPEVHRSLAESDSCSRRSSCRCPHHDSTRSTRSAKRASLRSLATRATPMRSIDIGIPDWIGDDSSSRVARCRSQQIFRELATQASRTCTKSFA